MTRLELDIRDDSLGAEAFLASGPGISRTNRALTTLVQDGEPPADLVGTVFDAFQELVLQVERSVRRGRDPFMDVLYPGWAGSSRASSVATAHSGSTPGASSAQ